MPEGRDPHLVGPLGGEGREDDEVRIAHDHPGVDLEFFGELVAEGAALLHPVVLAGTRQLLLDSLRDEGRGDDVGMGVDVAAPEGTVILQHGSVAEAAVTAQVCDACAVDSEEVRHVCRAEVGPGARVFRRVRNQLVGPDRVHLVEHAGAPSFEIPLDPQQGLLVGGDPNEPGAVLAHGGDLLGVHGFVPRAEGTGANVFARRWAGTSGQHLHPPLGGYDHPAAEDRISAKLRHDRLSRRCPRRTPPLER